MEMILRMPLSACDERDRRGVVLLLLLLLFVFPLPLPKRELRMSSNLASDKEGLRVPVVVVLLVVVGLSFGCVRDFPLRVKGVFCLDSIREDKVRLGGCCCGCRQKVAFLVELKLDSK